MDYQTILGLAVLGLILGFGLEGDTNNPNRPAYQKFFQIIKWISGIILFLFALVVVGALSDGIGDIPLLGGAVWVRGHWRRR